MQYKQNKGIVPLAKALRKNMTKEEKHIWYDFLRTHECKFLRQKVIGSYIADFYCAKAKLVIEIDGAQHLTKEAKQYDDERTKFLESYGISVLRISNQDISKNFHSVCEYINGIVRQLVNKE